MSRTRSLSATVCIVVGGLWIFLTGACSEAVFKGMPSGDKLTLELILTLPGCLVALAGLTMLLEAILGGVLLLAYAGLLSLKFTGALLHSGGRDPQAMTGWFLVANAPSLCLAVWAVVLILQSRSRNTP